MVEPGELLEDLAADPEVQRTRDTTREGIARHQHDMKDLPNGRRTIMAVYMVLPRGKEASYPRTFRLEFGSPRVPTADARGVGQCGAGLAGRCLRVPCAAGYPWESATAYLNPGCSATTCCRFCCITAMSLGSEKSIGYMGNVTSSVDAAGHIYRRTPCVVQSAKYVTRAGL